MSTAQIPPTPYCNYQIIQKGERERARERERESSYLTSSIIFSGCLGLLIAYCLLTKN